jgi:valyl-tRNA synthetase
MSTSDTVSALRAPAADEPQTRQPTVPDRPTTVLNGLEAKWDAEWQKHAIYRFDRSRPRSEVYAIDTPPPTVSGSLHLGTVFGYVQFDAIARFWRMRGKEVFFPVGWDDNGLPTERRVQNHYRVRCDPSLPYEAGLHIGPDAKGQRPVSRRNFIELCNELTAQDEKVFEQVFRDVGLSVAWELTYATIDERSQRVAQRAFLRNLTRGEAYAAEAPTMWDVDFQTAVAQAEMEDRTTPGRYHRLAFHLPSGDVLAVDTTRPELLAACVAVVVHPDDERWQPVVGTAVSTPLFGVDVPIVAHHLADPEKGTGAAMICTFGDSTDVVWWRDLGLPLRSIVQRDGRLQGDVPSWLDSDTAVRSWQALAGLSTTEARRKIAELLEESSELLADPRPIDHEVKYYERGERPLEIVTSRQWYIANGAHDGVRRDALLAAGRQLNWHPDFMRVRYEHWVDGLNGDWLVSRQRYFGVPFPIWYPIAGDGTVLYENPITPDESDLPVDPQSEAPQGYDEAQRAQPGGFVGDPDIMDTWATSSLTPQIAAAWEDDPDLFARVFPMDLRPQGPEIIRTWLFSTVLRSQLEHGSLPWSNTSINGWILDPDRKKMSKSKGNVITPEALVAQHGADGLRYWACSGAPGTDTAVDPAQMQVGRRLAIKLLNASKFVLGVGESDGPVTDPLDIAMLQRLRSVIIAATQAFENYQYQHALDRAESFFWTFCDDYLELVKTRAYGATLQDGDPPPPEPDSGTASARTALRQALSIQLRLFAPFLPFVAEEIWSWWQAGSIHRADWPAQTELPGVPELEGIDALSAVGDVLSLVRRAKTEQSRSMRQPVTRLVITDTSERLAVIASVSKDLSDAGNVGELVLTEGETLAVDVQLESN